MALHDFDVSEVVQIVVSALGIALAFSYVWQGESFLAILFIVSMAFVLHELGHKYMAIRYGAHARYQMWVIGLVICIILAMTIGFVIAAPGAVYIYGRELTRQQSGKVSLAGPGVNIILSLLFYIGALIFVSASSILLLGAYFNAFLAVFNLIPFDPLDGAKIMRWDKRVWAAAFAISALLVILTPV
jgi:Zn-dependent protease